MIFPAAAVLRHTLDVRLLFVGARHARDTLTSP